MITSFPKSYHKNAMETTLLRENWESTVDSTYT